MRQRFHIDRQVSKLADSLTPEVILGVLKKLSKPKVAITKISNIDRMRRHAAAYEASAYGEPNLSSCTMEKEHRHGYTSWYCSCVYCKLHMAYTYVQLEINRAERTNRRSRADDLYHHMRVLRSYRTQLENIPMFPILKEHIKDAKKCIGQSITELRGLAMQAYSDKEDTVRDAKDIINEADRHESKISWF